MENGRKSNTAICCDIFTRLDKALVRLLPAIFVFLASVTLLRARENVISSNDIEMLTGSGDTLWLYSIKGLDYTTDAGADSVVWQHIDKTAFPLAFGNGRMLSVLPREDELSNTNDLWLYTHGEGGSREYTGYIDADSTNYLTHDAVWSSGYFWLASGDGGLLRLDSTVDQKDVFYAGLDKAAFPPKQFPPDTAQLSPFPDTSKKVIDVAADNQGNIWVASNRSFWRFSISDTVWSRLPDIASDACYLSAGVNRFNDSSAIYSTAIAYDGNQADTGYYRYTEGSDESAWQRVLEHQPEKVSFAPGNHLFILYGNDIYLYQDDGAGKLEERTDGRIFTDAILDASDVSALEIRDITFTATQADTFLWVATNRGLFVSRNPFSSQPDFSWHYREFKVGSGLSEAYAAPGIINSDNPSTMFVYEIADNDRATIDIYDYNMDHVIRIEQPQDRSKLPTWDGTLKNNGAQPVAPGVYYFKIHTKKGKRAFGKVVVARAH